MVEANGTAAMNKLHKDMAAWQATLLSRHPKEAQIGDVLELMGFMIQGIEVGLTVVAKDINSLHTRIAKLEAQNRGSD